MNYLITIREGSKKGKKFIIKADSHEEAAQKAMPKVSRGAVAIRVTGELGKSGIFQGYKSVRTGGSTSDGPNFHVMG